VIAAQWINRVVGCCKIKEIQQEVEKINAEEMESQEKK